MNPEELAGLGPLHEETGAVGAFNDDGTVNVAIIRPCTSRGRRLRGLPPIYTQEMLAEEAGTFANWRMFLGHLTPEMAKAMNKAGRSIEDLGGRVVESYWDADYSTPQDDALGFQRGAVRGKAIPYPAVKALLEADPQALSVSINAWPKGVRPGEGHKGEKGMVIEGFRRDPQGSVDWVLSPGAGGGVVSEERAVSLLESIYDPAHGPGGRMNLSEMTEDQFRAYVAAEAPHLTDLLTEDDSRSSGGVDEDTVAAMLAEQEERLSARLEESVEEQATKLVEEREQARDFSARALARIDNAKGLTDGFRNDLRERYSVVDGQSSAGLLVESATELDAAVDADVQHALELIRESRPGPRVKGLGAEGGESTATRGGGSGWVEYLQEMGSMPVDGDGKPDKSKLLDGMVN